MRFSLLAAAAALAVSMFVALPAAAATGTADGSGADVSWPQCDGPLPSGQAFGVVGVNGGLGNTTNPCLDQELAWAAASPGASGQPAASLYVMAQDPGLLASWWPVSNQLKDGTAVTPPPQYGTCGSSEGGVLGEESAACAYVYGYDMAAEDLARGVADPAAHRWWIDVETTNTWALAPAINSADIEGMVAAFQAAGAPVGIYSTPYQWLLIAGATPSTSPLADLPTWVADTGDVTAAQANCYTRGLTPGSTVTLAQYQAGGFDRDLACHPLAAAPAPTITGTAAVDQTLTAHSGTWGPGAVTRHYQWLRGTAPIRGATGATYRTVAADGGHTLSVEVTGSEAGYTTITRTSRSTRIPVPTSRLTEPHTLATGRTLLAPNGRYRLTQQPDGNLVLYKDTGKALWSSHRFGHGYTTTMQSDGNLVTYAPGHHAVWATHTNGKHATYAVMQSDGNFVLYTSGGKAVWATHTNGR